jgi:hypothetical protein
MIVSQLLTPYVTLVIFRYLEPYRDRVARWCTAVPGTAPRAAA